VSGAPWDAPGFGLAPVAEEVGPFPLAPFLEAWWRHRGGGELMVAESATALLPLRLSEGLVEFLGEPDLTDYHSPLGAGGEELAASVLERLPVGSRFCFDSLPGEAAAVLAAGAARAGVEAARRRHQVAAVLDLPERHEEYLARLGPKERHEVRRKRRRFEAVHGPARLEPAGPRDLGVFAAMHRASAGPKGGFLTPAMEAFFADLLEVPGARLDLLVGTAGVPLAAAFGFQDERAYYLYNSAYQPQASASSPGAVLVDLLVRRALAERLHRFDFLKGEEPYKFRLGARPRPLFTVEGVR
jgi:CelD/BcsL family acetyltransferase involved in cellulose biosynthesis